MLPEVLVSADQVHAAIECCERLREALVDGRYALEYRPRDRAVIIGPRTPDAGTGVYISWCPFCGALLPRRLGDVRYDVLDGLGFDSMGSADENGELPSESELLREFPGGVAFETDRWWRERLAQNPHAFEVTLPELGSILEVPRGERASSVLVVGVAGEQPHGHERMLVVPGREGGWGSSAYAVSAWPYSTGAWTVAGDDRPAAAQLARHRVWAWPHGEWPEDPDWRFLQADDTPGSDDGLRLAPIPLGTLSAGEFVRKVWGQDAGGPVITDG